MIRLAVIGEDVSKSHSPAIHSFILRRFRQDCAYESVSIPRTEFFARAEELFAHYDGFNVTIPYKAEILSHLERLVGDAQILGAANTVVTRGRIGYHTDGEGFMLMLGSAGLSVRAKSVLVLGAGGAGRSVVCSLLRAGAQVFVYEKDETRLADLQRRVHGFFPCERVPLRPFDLIVNCTGVGMHKTEGSLPAVAGEDGDAAERLIKACGAAVDLIYEPARSEFLRVAEGYKKPVLNGEAMLFFQAYLADCIFLGRPCDRLEACRLWEEYRENL